MNFDHDLTLCGQLASGGKCKFDFDVCLCALFSIIEMTKKTGADFLKENPEFNEVV